MRTERAEMGSGRATACSRGRRSVDFAFSCGGLSRAVRRSRMRTEHTEKDSGRATACSRGRVRRFVAPGRSTESDAELAVDWEPVDDLAVADEAELPSGHVAPALRAGFEGHQLLAQFGVVPLQALDGGAEVAVMPLQHVQTRSTGGVEGMHRDAGRHQAHQAQQDKASYGASDTRLEHKVTHTAQPLSPPDFHRLPTLQAGGRDLADR